MVCIWFYFLRKYCKLNARTCSKRLLPFIILLVPENWCGVERKPENCFLEDMEIYYGVMVKYFYLFKFNYLRFGFCKCFISYKSYVSCAENFNRMVGIVSTKWLVVRWVSWDMVWFLFVSVICDCVYEFGLWRTVSWVCSTFKPFKFYYLVWLVLPYCLCEIVNVLPLLSTSNILVSVYRSFCTMFGNEMRGYSGEEEEGRIDIPLLVNFVCMF